MCVLCWSSEYCVPFFYVQKGNRFGCSLSRGHQLCEGVQRWERAKSRAYACPAVIGERRSVKYLIALHAYISSYDIMVLYIWASDLFFKQSVLVFLCPWSTGKLKLGDGSLRHNNEYCGVLEVSKMIRMVMGHFMKLKRCPHSKGWAFGKARL